jgi:hypothetical protein
MVISALAVQGRRVSFSGRVTPPLAKRKADRVIEVRLRVSCGREELVAKLTPRANGSFSGSVDAPAGAAAAVYRLRTKVRVNSRSAKVTDTFTLPRAVDFG